MAKVIQRGSESHEREVRKLLGKPPLKPKRKKKKFRRKSKWYFIQQIAKKTKSYKEFLQTKYWKKVRMIILRRDGFKCTACGSTQHLQVHHAQYKKIHFEEHRHLDKLHTLCDDCHREIHLIQDIE